MVKRKDAHRFCLISLLAAISSSALADGAPIVRFNIPQGDAIKTLQIFLTQSSMGMLYTSDDVRGVTTQAVTGEMTAEHALRQMLHRTDLEIRFDTDASYAWISRRGRSGDAARTARGEKTPESESRRSASESELEQVVVTGTLLHGVFDLVSPLNVVRRKEIQRAPYLMVQDVLRTMPMTFGGGPSEVFGGVGNYSLGTSVDLRGLGPSATLVLVNGHRVPWAGNDGDFVDVSNIPASAIDHIDVLPDGASATYGSDAIAGVVNIVMRDRVESPETAVRFAATSDQAGERTISQMFGHEWSDGRLFVAYQYQHRDDLAASARWYTASADQRARGGDDFRIPRAWPPNILNPSTLQPEFAVSKPTLELSKLEIEDLVPGAVNLQSRFAMYQLLPDRIMHNVYFSGSQAFGESLRAFVESRYTQRTVHRRLFGVDRVLVLPKSNPYFVTPYPDASFVAIGYNFLDALGPIESTATTASGGATLGVSGAWAKWRVNASGSFGRESTHFIGTNQPEQVALSAALASSDPNQAFNPFGANLPDVIRSIRMIQYERSQSTIESGTVVIDGPIASMHGGDAGLAVGMEWRQERLERGVRTHGEFERSVSSAFFELGAPVIGSQEQPLAAPRLELSFSGRAEQYSGSGGHSVNPKIGVRWTPYQSFKVHGSWGTSFRAPRLVDLLDSSQNSARLAVFADATSAKKQSLVLFRISNNPNLRQERSSTWTAGIDVAPVNWRPSLTSSLTWYSIDYRDRIARPGPPLLTEILLQESAWQSAINRNPTTAQIAAVCNSPEFRGVVSQCLGSAPILIDFTLVNLARTKVSGFDFNAEDRVGAFDVKLEGTYVMQFDQMMSKTSPVENILDTVGNPLALRLRGTMDWRSRANDTGVGAGLSINHSGAYRDFGTRRVSALTSLDVRIGYRTERGDGLLDGLESFLNITNALNREPPWVNREPGYDAQNAQPVGRVIAIGVQKAW